MGVVHTVFAVYPARFCGGWSVGGLLPRVPDVILCFMWNMVKVCCSGTHTCIMSSLYNNIYVCHKYICGGGVHITHM